VKWRFFANYILGTCGIVTVSVPFTVLWREQDAVLARNHRQQIVICSIASAAMFFCLTILAYIFVTADPILVAGKSLPSPDERLVLFVETYQRGFIQPIRYTELEITGEDYGGVKLAKWSRSRVRIQWLNETQLRLSFCSTEHEPDEIQHFTSVYQPSQRTEPRWNGHDWPSVPVGDRHAPIHIEYTVSCATSE